MNERILDMSALSQADYERIKTGWEQFNKNDCARYFGYVDKKDLKKLCRVFNYVDTRSWVSGLLFVPAVIGGAYVGYKISEFVDNRRKENNEN